MGATSLYVQRVENLENKIQNFNYKKEITLELKNEILSVEIFNKDLNLVKKQLECKIFGENLQNIKISEKNNFLLNSAYFDSKIYPIENLQINKKVSIYTDGSYYCKKSNMSQAFGGWSALFDYGGNIEEHFGPVTIVDESSGSFICEIIAIIQALGLLKVGRYEEVEIVTDCLNIVNFLENNTKYIDRYPEGKDKCLAVKLQGIRKKHDEVFLKFMDENFIMNKKDGFIL